MAAAFSAVSPSQSELGPSPFSVPERWLRFEVDNGGSISWLSSSFCLASYTSRVISCFSYRPFSRTRFPSNVLTEAGNAALSSPSRESGVSSLRSMASHAERSFALWRGAFEGRPSASALPSVSWLRRRVCGRQSSCEACDQVSVLADGSDRLKRGTFEWRREVESGASPVSPMVTLALAGGVGGWPSCCSCLAWRRAWMAPQTRIFANSFKPSSLRCCSVSPLSTRSCKHATQGQQRDGVAPKRGKGSHLDGFAALGTQCRLVFSGLVLAQPLAQRQLHRPAAPVRARDSDPTEALQCVQAALRHSSAARINCCG